MHLQLAYTSCVNQILAGLQYAGDMRHFLDQLSQTKIVFDNQSKMQCIALHFKNKKLIILLQMNLS